MKLTDEYQVEEVRALTFRLPFAFLMFHGKHLETRTWNTKYRGWVLICAGVTPFREAEIISLSSNVQLQRIKRIIKHHDIESLKGKAIGVGYLSDVREMQPEDLDDSFVSYNRLFYVHHYTHLHLIKPFDWKGGQGWKILDERTIDKIELL